MTNPVIPGPRGLLNSHILFLRRHPDTFLRLARRYGDLVYFRIGSREVFLLSHPTLIEKVLLDHYSHFEKDWGPRRGHSSFGGGLLTSEGDDHRNQRQNASSVFARREITKQMPEVAAIIETWSRRQKDGARIDVFEEMSLLGTEIAARVLFGSNVDPRTIVDAVAPISRGFRPYMFPHSDRFRIRRHRERKIHQVLEGMIASHDQGATGALLAPLMTGDRATPLFRDQMATFLVTGMETIRIATSWAWFRLSSDPASAERLRLEAQHPPPDQSPGSTTFAEAVLKESMRLHPPQWMVGRRVVTPYPLDNHVLPLNALVLMSPYVVQRDPRFFDDAGSFVPERWIGDERRPPLRFAYFPFGGGARRCIGETMAMMIGTAILSHIARDWAFEFERGAGKYQARLLLIPGPMPARLRAVSAPRSATA
jgi:cytochrome P450